MAEETLTLAGIDSLISGLEELGSDIPIAAEQSIDRAGEIIKNAAQRNILSMFTLDYATGALLDSVAHVAKRNESGAFGSAGVYKIDHVMVSNGLDPNKSISRPQLAYWYEFGIAPHSTVGRNVIRGGLRNQLSTNHPGSAPKPFLSNAYESNIDNINNAYVSGINDFHSNRGF